MKLLGILIITTLVIDLVLTQGCLAKGVWSALKNVINKIRGK